MRYDAQADKQLKNDVFMRQKIVSLRKTSSNTFTLTNSLFFSQKIFFKGFIMRALCVKKLFFSLLV